VTDAVRRIRSRSRFQVVYALMAGRATRTELARATGLSVPTVASVVTELTELGIVEVGERQQQGLGRPSERLRLARERGWVVGVDVAETYVDARVLDLGLRPVASARHDVEPAARERSEALVARLAAAVRQALARAEGGAPVRGIGVSFPGVVDTGRGTSVLAPNWPWRDAPLGPLLADALADLGAPVRLDNPMMALASAELWFGAGRSADSFVVVNLGTGVGAGLVLDRAVVRGVTGSAGEWGHTTLVLDGRACTCGRTGCVEAYLGAPGIARTLAEHGEVPEGGQRAVVGCLTSGTRPAQAALERTVHYAAAALGNLVNLLNPATITLAGWVMDEIGDMLLPPLRAELQAHALGPALAALEVSASQVPGNAVAVGMATLALEHYLAEAGIGGQSTKPDW
jgi:predicted NBD/HSP70 family sugar kinase